MPPGPQTTASAKRQSKGAAQLDGPGGASLEPSGPRSHLDIQQLADLIEPISFDLALPQSLLEPPDGNRYRAVARHPCGTRQLPQFQAACPPFRVQTMPSQPRDSSLHHAETTRRSAQFAEVGHATSSLGELVSISIAECRDFGTPIAVGTWCCIWDAVCEQRLQSDRTEQSQMKAVAHLLNCEM